LHPSRLPRLGDFQYFISPNTMKVKQKSVCQNCRTRKLGVCAHVICHRWDWTTDVLIILVRWEASRMQPMCSFGSQVRRLSNRLEIYIPYSDNLVYFTATQPSCGCSKGEPRDIFTCRSTRLANRTYTPSGLSEPP
jgi:hypothetical protein